MRGIIPTRWLAGLGRIGPRPLLRVAAAAVVLAAAWAVQGLCRPRLHIASGALHVTPDMVSESRPPEVIRARMASFLTAQRALLAGDGVLVPAVMGLEGVGKDEAGGMIDTLREGLCVETALADQAPAGTLFVTVAWPESAAGRGDDRPRRSADIAYRLTRGLLTACVVDHTKRRQQREQESPVARATRAARDDLDAARKALDEFIAALAPEELAAVAGAGPEGLDHLVAEGLAGVRRMNEQLKDHQELTRAIEQELARAGKDANYRIQVPAAALSADPAVGETARAVAACEARIAALAPRGAEADKPRAEAAAELAALRKALAEALGRCLDRLNATGGQLAARQAERLAALAADRQRLSLAAGKVLRYRVLQDELAAARDGWRAARTAEPEARRAEQRDHVGFEVKLYRDPHLPDPASPYRPITLPAALAGLVTAGALAAGYLLLAERRLLGRFPVGRRPEGGAGRSGDTGGVKVLATIPRVPGGEVIRTE